MRQITANCPQSQEKDAHISKGRVKPIRRKVICNNAHGQSKAAQYVSPQEHPNFDKAG